MESPIRITPVFTRHKSEKALKPIVFLVYKRDAIRNYIRCGLTTLVWDEKKNRPKDVRDGFLMDEAMKEITEYCIHMETQGQKYDKKSIEDFLKTKKLTDVFNFYDFY